MYQFTQVSEDRLRIRRSFQDIRIHGRGLGHSRQIPWPTDSGPQEVARRGGRRKSPHARFGQWYRCGVSAPDSAPSPATPPATEPDVEAGPNPQLAAAAAALKTGHFAAARALLALPPMAGDEAQRQKIRWRMSPDPMVAGLIALCLALFLYLALTTQH